MGKKYTHFDIESFLTSVTPEKPCGENLEHELDFQLLEQACQGKKEQQFGETIIPAVSADWVDVETKAVALLKRTKDLRVIFILMHAWTHLYGLKGYAEGLSLINDTSQLYWDVMYPQLEGQGQRDPFDRINSFEAMGDKSSITLTLRNISLLQSNNDKISLREAQRLIESNENKGVSYPGGRVRLVDELNRHGNKNVIINIHQGLDKLQKLFNIHLREYEQPKMDDLCKMIGAIYNVCRKKGPKNNSNGDAFELTEIEISKTEANEHYIIKISSREEAQIMLNKVKDYFIRYEPSHAAPLLIERIQKVIELDFINMVRELAPEGVKQLELLIGKYD